MIFYNTIDEQGRFLGFKVDCTGDGQFDSHTYSVKYVREVLCYTGTPYMQQTKDPFEDLEATLRDAIIPVGK